MKRKLKILHLASFLGNIGDYANHEGFYGEFEKKYDADFTQLEIRKFYKNRQEMKFGNSFVKMVNSYDMLILGGGGFFDLKWDYSCTGTTIDFSEKIVNNITIPVLVNGMGYHEYGSVEKENISKFNKFLKMITNNSNWLVTVRNDGSYNRMKERYADCMNSVYKVPDNGFYFSPKKNNRLLLDTQNTIWIGLNITNELFNKKFNKKIDISHFNKLISGFINTILKKETKINIILFPHAYQDTETIGKILVAIEDKYKRERIVIAPLPNESKTIEYLFDLYRICASVIGMRFHSNVCCIGMGVPTIGLAGHEQISSLYEDLGISDRCVRIDNIKFTNELLINLYKTLNNSEEIKRKYRKINFDLKKDKDTYFRKIKKFIDTKVL